MTEMILALIATPILWVFALRLVSRAIAQIEANEMEGQ